MDMVAILMTSRSGSSMIADIVRTHGYYWARDEKRNPLVGGRKVRYNSFENQTVKEFNKREFGTPLGDMVVADDSQLRGFRGMVELEYANQERCVWKGAVEFFPLWHNLHETGAVNLQPMLVYRPKKAVMDSLRAKRQGRVDEEALIRITDKRYELIETLASEYAMPLVLTDDIVKGDYSSLLQAFEAYNMHFSPSIVETIVKPDKWETER